MNIDMYNIAFSINQFSISYNNYLVKLQETRSIFDIFIVILSRNNIINFIYIYCNYILLRFYYSVLMFWLGNTFKRGILYAIYIIEI